MHSSAACAGQAHSPAAGAMHSCVGPAHIPSNVPLPVGDLDPHLIQGSLYSQESVHPNGISIGSAVVAQLTHAHNTQTYRPCYVRHLVVIDRIYALRAGYAA